MKRIFVAILIGTLFLGLRLYRIEDRMNFSMDQGLFMLRAQEIWDDKMITLLGPPASPTIEGKHFFQGPITYYWLVVLGVIANWDPVKITWLITIMSLGSLWFLYKAAEEMFDKNVALTAAVMWTVLPKAIDFAGLIWNPSLLLILVPPLIYYAVKAIKTELGWWYGIWGLLLGLTLQCHFQAGLLVVATAVVLIIKKVELKNWVWGGVTFLIGYAPLVIFDMRNNFYNTRIIWTWLNGGGSGGFELQQFYFLEFLPILIILLAKHFYKWRWWIIFGITLTLGWEITKVHGAKGMPQYWSYADLKITSEIVTKESGDKFNVVNLLSGDTQFMPLRYLLIVKNKNPMPTDKYENQLWVVTYNNYVLGNSQAWEMKNTNQMTEIKRIKINPMVDLVKLE